ncbi:MAG TPA: hypothetical protein P5040_03110 [Smithella sp.]|nr:hypothetical protein [Smithella sp.]HRS97148.1 hypothetical protein [Smithella sp.]
MAWKVEWDKEKGFIHTVYSGVVTKNDLLDSMAQTLKMIEGKGPQKFFTEWISAFPKLSTTEIFAIPCEWEAAGVDKESVLAVVVQKNGQSRDDAKFYENVCRNRGWRVRVFDDRDAAIAWLDEQEVTPPKT